MMTMRLAYLSSINQGKMAVFTLSEDILYLAFMNVDNIDVCLHLACSCRRLYSVPEGCEAHPLQSPSLGRRQTAVFGLSYFLFGGDRNPAHSIIVQVFVVPDLN